MEAYRLGCGEGVGRGMAKRRVVILDSNTLIYIVSGLITLDAIVEAAGGPGLELVTTDAVIDELKALAGESRGLKARRARAALYLTEKIGVSIVKTGLKDADDSLEAAALRLKGEGAMVYVATSDRELRRRLRIHGLPTIYYRESKGDVEVEWEPI
ncbi:MAG: hypothetical protein F7B17_02165 [Desulfurococcales archaeon]|nr:hypothetical protein [Desulfurococcales archaeon]